MFVIIAVSASNTALAQCSFSWDLYFDPASFPNLSSGYDGNNYKNEGDALSAAKRAIYGPSGIRPSYSVEDIWKWRRCGGHGLAAEIAHGSCTDVPPAQIA